MKYLMLLFPMLIFSQQIWDGPEVSFTKSNNVDINLEVNQDRITEGVWITRGNSGGSIFNIFSENSYSPGISPSGTLWAIGELTDNNLVFDDFRGFDGNNYNRPPLEIDLVLKLTNGTNDITDDIHIGVYFTSWTSGDSNGGGFSYRRSTNPNLNFKELQSFDVIIFPNPTNRVLNVQSNYELSLSIYDLYGKKLIESESNKIDLVALDSGIYILKILNKNTNNYMFKRVLKENN